MNEDLDDRVRERHRELVEELAKAPRGTTDTHLLAEHVVGLGDHLVLASLKETAWATRRLVYATVFLAIVTSASVVWAMVR